MKNLTKFQLVLLGLFFVAILAGVASFALYKGGKSGPGAVNLTIWGPTDASYSAFVESFSQETETANVYVAKSEAAFERDLISAIADGVAPDIVIFPESFFTAVASRLMVIPYDSYPIRDFKDTFLEEGGMFLTEQGVAALPLSVDPLVLYWNRDSFSAAGLPSTVISPRVGASSPSISRSSTVLPDPDPPTSDMNSPRSMRRFRSW